MSRPIAEKEVGFSVSSGFGPVQASIQGGLKESQETGWTCWSKRSQQQPATFPTETTKTVFDVPHGLKVSLEQAVGYCGSYRVSSTNIRKLGFK
jgi:hypothetical protein